MRNDATLWLNLGDSYMNGTSGSRDINRWPKQSRNDHVPTKPRPQGLLKTKDLVGMPWRVAFALQADGWWLRMDNIWHKKNPMPESVTDRPTKSHEYMFLFSKSAQYYYDADAIREKTGNEADSEGYGGKSFHNHDNDLTQGQSQKKEMSRVTHPNGRNKRSVWTIATAPFSKSHFATFPPKLIQPCILAGSNNRACENCGAPWKRITEIKDRANSLGKSWNDDKNRLQKGQRGCPPANKAPIIKTIGWQPTCKCDSEGSSSSIILDPFGGSGTTAMVAKHYGRRSIMIELNEEYAAMRDDEMAQEVLKL